MDRDVVAIGGFVALFVLMALRVPVGIAMGIVGVGGFGLLTNWTAAFGLLAQSPFSTVTSFNLSIIPMFVLMGTFAAAAGMSRDLFEASRAWFGHKRGGLAIATIAACGGFAAISGSAVATAATMTRVALPELRRAGYSPRLSTGVIAAGGTLGIMVPPSLMFVLYSLMTDVDLTKLFIAGLLPGIMGMLMYMATVTLIGSEDMPRGEQHTWPERFAALRGVWPALTLFVFVIGGMYGGVFTVTEAAGVGAVGALLIGVAQGRLGPAAIMECLVNALRTTAAIFMIVIGAYLFGYFLTISQTPQHIIEFLVGLPVGPYGVLALVLAVYFVLGALMDELAMILITVPIVFPAMTQLGFDPVWFGVIVVMTCVLGLICPPVGMNVFVVNSLAPDVKLATIYRGVMPFIVCDLLRLLLLCLFPGIALLLPRLL
jgi:C4-dicarboxylate transporter, DctM subunit